MVSFSFIMLLFLLLFFFFPPPWCLVLCRGQVNIKNETESSVHLQLLNSEEHFKITVFISQFKHLIYFLCFTVIKMGVYEIWRSLCLYVDTPFWPLQRLVLHVFSHKQWLLWRLHRTRLCPIKKNTASPPVSFQHWRLNASGTLFWLVQTCSLQDLTGALV